MLLTRHIVNTLKCDQKRIIQKMLLTIRISSISHRCHKAVF